MSHLRAFLIAGEMSGDRLGADLMAGLRDLADFTFEGVGGPRMQAQGLTSLFPMDELSVMGLAEIIPKYPALRRRLHQTAQAVIDAAPDVLITIDSPEFSLRVARLVRKARPDLRIVHYVAPSVWAWRPGRARKMAPFVDQVLALLPFEPPYMEAAGMRCDFVGHPVVGDPQATDHEIAALRDRFDLADAPLLLVLPGSRRSEISRLMPVFGPALEQVLGARPEFRVVIPAATSAGRDLIGEASADWKHPPALIDPEDPDYAMFKRAAFGAARGALAASGTVSLELAAAGTTMVIAYDMSPISRVILSRMLRIDTVTLVNLVSETRAVPEFIGAACRPEKIAPALTRLLGDPGPQREALQLTMERLGRGGEAPGLRAARAVLDGLGASVANGPGN